MIRAKDWHPDVIADYPQEYRDACEREFIQELEEEKEYRAWCEEQKARYHPLYNTKGKRN